MRVERTYLVRKVQVYEGDPASLDLSDDAIEFGYLTADQDQVVCDTWTLVDETTVPVDCDFDQLEVKIIGGRS